MGPVTHNGGTRIVDKLLRYLDERQVHKERWVAALVDAPVPVGLVNGPADPVSGRRYVLERRGLIKELI